MNGIVFSIINIVGTSWFLPLLFIALGILISCYVATNAFPKADAFWLCNGVILFYFVYLLTNIDFAVVYWLCAMGYYLKFPIALLTFYFINKQQLSIWQWITLILACFTIGAGNEAFSPLMLVFLFINGMFYLHSNRYDFKITFADIRVKRICIVVSIIIALMIVVFVAPGNYARLSDTTEFHRPSSFVDWIMGLAHASATYHYFVLFYMPYYLVLMALSYGLGVKAYRINWLSGLMDNKRNILLAILFVYAVYIFCTILPSVFLFGGFGVQRNYTHAIYMTILTLCVFGFLWGYWKPTMEKVMKCVSVVGLLLLLSVTIINCKIDFPIAKAYAQSVNERIAYCNDMQGKGYQGILEVEPLEKPATIDVKYMVFHIIGQTNIKPMLYYISETKETPNEYAYHMKRLYGWDFDIVLKKE